MESHTNRQRVEPLWLDDSLASRDHVLVYIRLLSYKGPTVKATPHLILYLIQILNTYDYILTYY